MIQTSKRRGGATAGRVAGVLALALAIVVPAPSSAAASEPSVQPNETLGRAAAAYVAGDASTAAREWERALESIDASGDRGKAAETRVCLAAAYQAAGQYPRARLVLRAALEDLRQWQIATPGAPAAGEMKRRRGEIANALGAVNTMSQRQPDATAWLDEARRLAEELGDEALKASVANNIGNLLAAQGKPAEAFAEYVDAGTHATAAGRSELAARATANAALAARASKMPADASRLADEAIAAAVKLPDTASKAQVLLAAGRAIHDQPPAADGAAGSNPQLRACRAFTDAADVAARVGNGRLRSYALGYQAELYEAAGPERAAEAMVLARRACFFAQQAGAPDALYRWQWQVGRLLRQTGGQKNTEEAILAMTQAKETLQGIRSDVALGCGNHAYGETFRSEAGQLYFQLADLLLTRTETPGMTRDDVQRSLRDARATIELLKGAELEDYFHDECVNQARSKAKDLDSIAGKDPGTAIVYFVALKDRIEILVSRQGELSRVTQRGVGADALTNEARLFLGELQFLSSGAHFKQGEKLYDWLIRPMKDAGLLKDVHTLVFVPDGALRTIPMAALNDGDQYLVEQFAVATTPGLALTVPAPSSRSSVRLLASGVSVEQILKVNGRPDETFHALPGVKTELENIGKLYVGRGQTLLDEEFKYDTVKTEIRDHPYAIVHIASHGVFEERSEDTFLLAYGRKIRLNELETLIQPSQFKGQPVELLTLSACQTAAGNDRAALGLAGIAVKAGARSAVASLWCSDDVATSRLISEFYHQLLKDPTCSKAEALRQAQLTLIRDKDLPHPKFWSPFIVIGNWQ